MEQSIEPIETPPHANALKSLNYQPFSGTFDHPAADRKSYRFKVMTLDVCVMRVEIYSTSVKIALFFYDGPLACPILTLG